MKKNTVKKVIKKTARITGKVAKIGLGFGLICLNVAATTVGAIICAITSQD